MLATLMHHAARRAGLHVLGVYGRPLDAQQALPGRFAVRRLGEDELLALCADPELDLRESFVRMGHACIGAFAGSELAGYVWFAYGDAPHVDGVRVGVPEHAVYRFKAFVRPAYRGQGIATLLYRAGDRMVARPGRSQVVNCVAVQNASSIAASLRSGDRLLGYLAYWRRGGRFLSQRTPGVAKLGLRFYLGG